MLKSPDDISRRQVKMYRKIFDIQKWVLKVYFKIPLELEGKSSRSPKTSQFSRLKSVREGVITEERHIFCFRWWWMKRPRFSTLCGSEILYAHDLQVTMPHHSGADPHWDSFQLAGLFKNITISVCVTYEKITGIKLRNWIKELFVEWLGVEASRV